MSSPPAQAHSYVPWSLLDGFVDSPPASPLPNLPSPSADLGTAQYQPNAPSQVSEIDEFIKQVVHGPGTSYLRGTLSFVDFRAQLIAEKDKHLQRLSEDESVTEALLCEISEYWRRILEVVEELRPDRMLVDLKVMNARLRDMEERLERYEHVVLSRPRGFEEPPFDSFKECGQVAQDALNGTSDGRPERLIDDYNDMRVIPEYTIGDFDSEDEGWGPGMVGPGLHFYD